MQWNDGNDWDWEGGGWNNKWRPTGSGTTSHARRARIQAAAEERDRLAALGDSAALAGKAKKEAQLLSRQQGQLPRQLKQLQLPAMQLGGWKLGHPGKSPGKGTSLPKGAAKEKGNSLTKGAAKEKGNSLPKGAAKEKGNPLPKGAAKEKGNSLPQGAGKEEGNSLPKGARKERCSWTKGAEGKCPS